MPSVKDGDWCRNGQTGICSDIDADTKRVIGENDQLLTGWLRET